MKLIQRCCNFAVWFGGCMGMFTVFIHAGDWLAAALCLVAAFVFCALSLIRQRKLESLVLYIIDWRNGVVSDSCMRTVVDKTFPGEVKK